MTEGPQVLAASEHAAPQAAEQLLPFVYKKLRKLAARMLAGERPGQTLQPTALVHEAYLALVGQGPPRAYQSSRHFFFAAAVAMCHVLVDRARRKLTRKHGGGWQQ
jgi:RNA polymerase sigma factor (TIGR02999 family)